MQSLVKQHTAALKKQKQPNHGFYGSVLYMIFPIWASLCWPGAMATLRSLAWTDSLYCTSIKHTALTSVQFSKIGLTLSLPTLCPTPIRLNYKEIRCFYVTMTLESITSWLNLFDVIEWSTERKYALWFAGKKVKNATWLILYYDRI